MKPTPTAEETLSKFLGFDSKLWRKDSKKLCLKVMIEFAQMHCKAALEAADMACDKVYAEENRIPKGTIQNAYPNSLIK